MMKTRVKNSLKELRTSLRGAFRQAAARIRALRAEGMSAEQRKASVVALCSLVLGAAFCAFIAWLIASIATDPSGFEELVGENLPLAATLYALANTLQVFALVIPGEPLELVAGYLFGVWGGLAVVSAGLALGEAIVFLTVKRLGPRFVSIFVSPDKLEKVGFIKDARKLNLLTFLMMFFPGTPKDLVTFVIGLTPMNLATWMAISIPARMFSIVISTVVGARVAEDDWGLALLVFLATCVISLLGMLYYVAISRQAYRETVIEAIGRREWEDGGRRTNDAGASPERHGQSAGDAAGTPRSDGAAVPPR